MSDTENSMITEASPEPGRTMKTLTSIRDWTDARLPIVAAWKKHMSEYYAPKNFNFWYFFWSPIFVSARDSVDNWNLFDNELHTQRRECLCIC
jgi:hypothetical protein